MNILFVTDFYKPHIGGVEKLFSSLAEELVVKGEKVTFITWKYDRTLRKTEVINGVEVIRIAAPSRMLFSLIALPTILKRARKANLIHTSTYSSAIGAWFGSRLAGKKVFITVHEVWGDLWQKMPFLSKVEKWLFQRFERWLLRLNFDKYIAVSDFTRNKLEESGIAPEKITRIYNGIDYNLPQWKDLGLPFTFCFFGRAGASKGLDILIEASEKIAGKYPEVRFKFIISPQSKNIYQHIISKIKNGKLNPCSSVYSQLPYPLLEKELLSSNCVIIPSLCEGFGFTAVEASAMNIPIISSDMGSLPEVVSGKVITMKKYNADGLVEAMEAAIIDKFEIIPQKKFTIESFVKNHNLLYLECNC